MNQVKTGLLIKKLRLQMNLTQKQLAQLINVSDKAISKWECGNGCPDISSLYALSDVLKTDINILLSGEFEKNESEKGIMKKMKFYVCETCGNIITSTSEASVACCGNKLSALEPKQADPINSLNIQETEDELFITSSHQMTKEHYISFAAFLNDRTSIVCKQYPEWNFQFTLPLYRSGKLVWYCTKCGLFYQDIKK